MGLRVAAYLIALAIGSAALAFEPESLPDVATVTHDMQEDPASLTVPTGVYDGTLPVTEAEGVLRERAWRVPSATLSTLRIVQGLRADLAAQGYEVILDCDTQVCGGFDFRFGLSVLPAPAMNVDLFDFRVISARRGVAAEQEYAVVLVSRGRSNRFVQVLELRPGDVALETDPEVTPGDEQPAVVPDVVQDLIEDGHVVLGGLDFPTGAGGLSDRSYPSLAALAAYLKGHEARVVALVGHTDAVGSLDANVALSRRRAEAVRARLISVHGVPSGQIVAQGAGYLAPVASNLSQAGREENRRVEAVLLSAE